MFYKILILAILINLSKSQTTNSIGSLVTNNNIGRFNSPCGINSLCIDFNQICTKNKCLCRNGFK